MSTIAPIHLNSNGAAAAARQNSPSSAAFEQFLPSADDRTASSGGAILQGSSFLRDLSSGQQAFAQSDVAISGQLPPDAPPYERGGPPADGTPYEPLPPPLGGLPYEPTTLPADGLPYQPSLPPADGLPYDRAGLPADGIPYELSTPPADSAPYQPIPAAFGGLPYERTVLPADRAPYESLSTLPDLSYLASGSNGQGFLQQTVVQVLDRMADASGSRDGESNVDGTPSASNLLLAHRLWTETQATSAALAIRETVSDLILPNRLG